MKLEMSQTAFQFLLPVSKTAFSRTTQRDKMKQIPEYIIRALHELRYAVQRDSYNLTRDDHDAILH